MKIHFKTSQGLGQTFNSRTIMELGAKYALGGELLELFPDTSKITDEYGTYENLYMNITGKKI